MLKKVFLIGSVLLSMLVHGQNSHLKTLKKHAQYFLQTNLQNYQSEDSLTVQFIVTNNDTLYLFSNNNLFVLFSSNSSANQILGYSFENGIDTSNIPEFSSFIGSLYQDYNPESNRKAISETHGPLLNSLFGQVNCHDENRNIINVTNIYTPNQVAVGCVAVSLVTALHYSQWPVTGAGSHEYTDNLGSTRGTHAVDFSKASYDWENILFRYDYAESSSTEREALGNLAYHAAVALDMDFENGGSTSSVSKIPLVLSRYFKHYGEYKSANDNDFYAQIDSMIIKNRVVPLAISGNGYGHSVVCDGWKTDDSGNKYYHLNMGWWGTTNGWYQIQNSFNAGGYSAIDGGVFQLVPTPSLQIAMNNGIFDLEWQAPPDIQFNTYELQVKIGRANWQTLGDSLKENSYSTSFDGQSSYGFRVRMNYTEFPELQAWSNMEVYDPDAVSLSFNDNQTIQLFPNPTSNEIRIAGLNNPENLIVVNNQGIKLMEEQTSSNTLLISLKDFPAGIYYVIIQQEKKIIRKKIIKI